MALHICARLPLHSQQPWLEWSCSSQKCLTSKMNKLQLIPCQAYGMLSFCYIYQHSHESDPGKTLSAGMKLHPATQGCPSSTSGPSAVGRRWSHSIALHRAQCSNHSHPQGKFCMQRFVHKSIFLKVYYLEEARQCFFNVSSPRLTAIPISYTKTKI